LQNAQFFPNYYDSAQTDRPLFFIHNGSIPVVDLILSGRVTISILHGYFPGTSGARRTA
jgi:hypothetical protein